MDSSSAFMRRPTTYVFGGQVLGTSPIKDDAAEAASSPSLSASSQRASGNDGTPSYRGTGSNSKTPLAMTAADSPPSWERGKRARSWDTNGSSPPSTRNSPAANETHGGGSSSTSASGGVSLKRPNGNIAGAEGGAPGGDGTATGAPQPPLMDVRETLVGNESKRRGREEGSEPLGTDSCRSFGRLRGGGGSSGRKDGSGSSGCSSGCGGDDHGRIRPDNGHGGLLSRGGGASAADGEEEEESTNEAREIIKPTKDDAKRACRGDQGYIGEVGGVVRCTRPRQQQQKQRQKIVRVVVHEVLSEDFGLFTWPAGVVLAYLVWARRAEFRGLRVVEIGAGTALPGLLAAKLGAAVVLTDREEAPWVLENMRGAVAANGLTPEYNATGVCVGVGGDGGGGGGDGGGDGGDGDGRSCGGSGGGSGTSGGDSRTEERKARSKGHDETDKPRDEKEEEEEAEEVEILEGTCTVRGLSWGRVGLAAIRLAREKWRPQVVLGADVFYSSEHFDSVLATVFMLLSCTNDGPAAAGGDDGGSSNDDFGGVGVDSVVGASLPISRDVIGCTADAGVCSAPGGCGDHAVAATYVDRAATAVATVAAPAATTAAKPSLAAAAAAANGGGASTARLRPHSPVEGRTDTVGAMNSSGSYWSPFMGSSFYERKGVFLTAYHERSARRSLRPLLRKWGMEARVLHGAPQRILPPSLWETGRYDSVAIIEITLLR